MNADEKRKESVKFAVEINGKAYVATTDKFKVVYDGRNPGGIITCEITNKMFAGLDRFFRNVVTLLPSQYGLELKEKIYEGDIVKFVFKGKEHKGIVVNDTSLPLIYISTCEEGREIKVPLYRAEKVETIGTTLLGDTVEAPSEAAEKNFEEKPPEGETPSSGGVYEIYTDGCIENAGLGYKSAGAAYIINRFGKGVKEKGIFLGDETNIRAEMIAACEAIEEASTFSPQQIKVITDSQYVVSGAMIWSKGWIRNGWINKSGDEVKNKDLWERLLALKEAYNVTFEWIGKDKEDPLNEKVTQMSHRAAQAKRMSA